jgi:hypothetical protein
VDSAPDLRDSWQAKVLRETCKVAWMGSAAPRGKLGAVMLSVFAHGLDAGALAILLKGIFPDFYSISAPFICSAAKVDKAGRLVADVVMRDDEPPRKDQVLFYSLRSFEWTLRHLADRLKLDDTDRVKLFQAATNWIVADRRLDPAMDPADPDARRLVAH